MKKNLSGYCTSMADTLSIFPLSVSPNDTNEGETSVIGLLPKYIGKASYRMFKDPERERHNQETFEMPNQDIIRDYMVNTGSTFEESMKWAVKQDALNKDRMFPWFQNLIEKTINKEALERDGIKRLN